MNLGPLAYIIALFIGGLSFLFKSELLNYIKPLLGKFYKSKNDKISNVRTENIEIETRIKDFNNISIEHMTEINNITKKAYDEVSKVLLKLEELDKTSNRVENKINNSSENFKLRVDNLNTLLNS